jgi:CBS domain-containing membrane protein
MNTSLCVRDLMTDQVIAVRPNDDLATLRGLMIEHDIRHIPVVDADGDLAGLVSHRDLLRSALIEQTDTDTLVERLTLEQIKVREVMTDHVVNSAPDDDLRDAATLMVENKFGCLPVTEGDQLVGILTESDFVRLMAHGD